VEPSQKRRLHPGSKKKVTIWKRVKPRPGNLKGQKQKIRIFRVAGVRRGTHLQADAGIGGKKAQQNGKTRKSARKGKQ